VPTTGAPVEGVTAGVSEGVTTGVCDGVTAGVCDGVAAGACDGVTAGADGARGGVVWLGWVCENDVPVTATRIADPIILNIGASLA
jgi:hypothetical protein